MRPTTACLFGGAIFSAGIAHGAIANGSFETGDFSGWDVFDDQYESKQTLAVRPDGAAPYLVLSPDYSPHTFQGGFFATHGGYAATHAFNGTGPLYGPYSGTISISQVALIDAGELRFDTAGLVYLRFPDPGQGAYTLDVNIRDASSGSVLQSTNIIEYLYLGDRFYDSGLINASVDVSAFLGQSVRIEFLWTIPDDTAGDGAAFLDNVRLVPAPAGVVLVPLVGLAASRRRR